MSEGREGVAPAACRIIIIACESVAAIIEAGPYGPVFGELIDIGTSALLAGGLGPASLKDAVSRFAAESAHGLILVEDLSWEDAGDSGPRRGLLDEAAREGRLLAILWERGEAHEALLVVAGIGLPNMGFAGTCDAVRFEGTVRFLLGDAPAAENSVFAEPPAATTAEEQALMHRLTKLYGA
jgi:hypothetical protein